MSLQIFTRAKTFSSALALLAVTLLCASPGQASWKVKFDRTPTDMKGQSVHPFFLEKETVREPASPAPAALAVEPLPELMPAHELSLILSEGGFSPQKLHIKKGELYRVTVVNVSTTYRNSSFVIPSMAIYEGAYFAQPKTFQLQADQEGLFQFLSPESGTRGELVVYETAPAPSPIAPPAEELGEPQLIPLRIPTSAGRD